MPKGVRYNNSGSGFYLTSQQSPHAQRGPRGTSQRAVARDRGPKTPRRPAGNRVAREKPRADKRGRARDGKGSAAALMTTSLLACASAVGASSVIDKRRDEIPAWVRARSGRKLRPSDRTGDHELLDVSRFATQLSDSLKPANILGSEITDMVNAENPIFEGEGGCWKVGHGITSYIANQVVAALHPANRDVPDVEMTAFRDSSGIVTVGSRRQKVPGLESIRDYVKKDNYKIPGFSFFDKVRTRLNAEEIKKMRDFDSMIGLIKSKEPVIDKLALYGICDIDAPQNVFFIKGKGVQFRFVDLDCSSLSTIVELVLNIVSSYAAPWELISEEDKEERAVKDLVMRKLKIPRILEDVNEALAPLREYVQTPLHQKIKQFMIDAMSLIYGPESYIVKKHIESFESVESALIAQQYPESLFSELEFPDVFVDQESIKISDTDDALLEKLPKIIRDNIIKRDGDMISIPNNENFLDSIPQCEISHLLPLTKKRLFEMGQRLEERSLEKVSTQIPAPDLVPDVHPENPQVAPVKHIAHDRELEL